MNINDLNELATQMMQQIKGNLNQTSVKGESGGGQVRVTVNGLGRVTNVEIQPGALNDCDLLSDWIMGALNQAYQEIDKAGVSHLSKEFEQLREQFKMFDPSKGFPFNP
jgi:hypothetical protein